MGKWNEALGRWNRGSDTSVTLKASGAETASTIGTGVAIGDAGTMLVTLAITAASGTTPTMTVNIEGSWDGGTNWVVLGTIGANGYRAGLIGTAPSNLTTTATVRANLTAAPLVRYNSTIGGTTPSFTYSVVADTNR